MSKQPSQDELRGWLLGQEPEVLVSRLMGVADAHPEIAQALSEEWQLCHGDPGALVEAAVSAVIDAALKAPLPEADGEATTPLQIGEEAEAPHFTEAWSKDLPREDWTKVADKLEARLVQPRDDPEHDEERSALFHRLMRILDSAGRSDDLC